jgi:hypothetical protein
MRVAIADGSHYISMETADGTLGSPETRVVDGTPNTITLPLWPVVHVKGVVKLPHADLPQGPRSGNAGGITVVLQPGNIVAQTDENGGFDFAPQAMDPNATISVDDSTLPSAFAAPPAQKVPAGGNVTIVLKPSKKIQKIIF